MSTNKIRRGFRYVYAGTLTGVIADVAAAQRYLAEHDDMAQHLDEDLPEVLDVRWELDADGLTYRVKALATRELTPSEIVLLTEWVKGQHSDGLGEGFEQQDFAWMDAAENDMPWDEDDEVDAYDDGEMIRFDWETNTSKFELVDDEPKGPAEPQVFRVTQDDIDILGYFVKRADAELLVQNMLIQDPKRDLLIEQVGRSSMVSWLAAK